MPTILELFKNANGNRDVTVWDGTTQKSGIIDRVRDVASAELDPNGIRVNFYKSIVTPPFIYGLETPRITTKGGVDPVRTLSVNSTRYNGKTSDGKEINSPKITIGSLLGGSANRPSDTIFDSTTGAPITKGTLGGGPGDYNALKYAIDPDKEDYYVSQYPSDKPAFAGALKKNPVAALLNEGKSQLGNIVSKKIAKIRGSKKDTPQANAREIVYTNKNKYSTIDKLKERKFDTFNSASLDLAGWDDKGGKDNVASTYFNANDGKNTPYVYFEKYGVSNNTFRILLPAVVSGISEEVSPEWSTYKFIGSPFNSYRFQGVERSLSFEMKLYYETTTQRKTMINNLNLLRKTVFPSQNIVATQYPTSNNPNINSPTNPYTPLSFTGNLMYLTINGLYYKLLGYIETLSISIDDSTSWSSGNVRNKDGLDKPYPSVINVSIGMKIVENPTVDSNESGYTYNYDNYFTGDTSKNIQ